jgi:hypothetical protein
MPDLGPDICYSCQELLTLVAKGQLHLADFPTGGFRIMAFDADIVLETCQKCDWIAFDQEGRIILTPIGAQIAEFIARNEAANALRIQIVSMVRTYNWDWTGALRNGRQEALRRMPEDARQCFAESLALKRNWPSQLIRWWDELSKYQREIRTEENAEVGRHAEELSFEYEKKRTGVRPDWRALESSFNGYDILSRKSKSDASPIRIEVKGTALKVADAEFWVTRHEWRTAAASGDYMFHLWSLRDNNTLSIVPFAEVEKHIPLDRNKGRWENVKIRFGPFFSNVRELVNLRSSPNMRTPIPKNIRERSMAQINRSEGAN